MDLVTVKYLHVLSSTFLFGTGVGTAFYLLFISRTRDPAVIAPVARLVVVADWLFTATTIVVQPLTGLYLARGLHIPLSTPWLYWSISLASRRACRSASPSLMGSGVLRRSGTTVSSPRSAVAGSGRWPRGTGGRSLPVRVPSTERRRKRMTIATPITMRVGRSKNASINSCTGPREGVGRVASRMWLSI